MNRTQEIKEVSTLMMAAYKSLRRVARDAVMRARVIYWINNGASCLVVFIWHQVTPVFSPVYHHKFTWTPLAIFKQYLDFIASHFTVLRLGDALTLLETGKIKGKVAALTFDDGDASMERYALPVLQARGLPATFFVNSAYSDKPSTYWFPVVSYFNSGAETHPAWTSELREQASKLRNTSDAATYNRVREQVESLSYLIPGLGSRLVSPHWLARLDSHQYEIGAHGHEHQRHSMMSDEWQAANLSRNIQFLSQFNAYQPIFAVPFGRPWDWTPKTISIAKDLGLKVVLAHGGTNPTAQAAFDRQPSDGQAPYSTLSALLS